MQRHFTLEYWLDHGHYVGRIKDVPGIISHGKTLEELEERIIDACRRMVDDETRASRGEIQTKEIAFEVYYAPGPGQEGNMTG